MKTPIEELKEFMFSGKNYYVDEFFKPFIEKEKQVIADAYESGREEEYQHHVNSEPREYSDILQPEQYYKETFNK